MQQVVAAAPGRVNLIGEHTDHTGGLALPMAIAQGVQVVGRPADRIRLRSDSQPGEVVDVAPDGSDAPATGWGRYVAAVAAELHALGRPATGIEGVVSRTLPARIGLSSSAALEVAVAVALLRSAGCAGWDAPEVALACQRAEHRAVGVPSGVLDQSASLLGRTGHAVLLDCADLTWRPVPLPPGMAVVVIDSDVSRQLEGSGYADRVAQLRAALPVLAGRRPADVAAEEVEGLIATLPDVPARRLRHVVTENDRVRRSVEAFTAGDLAAVGRLWAASHASLREDFEVTVPETDALAQLLVDHGAVAARMTGGGFGGAVIGLVEATEADAVAAAAVDGYAAAFPDRRPTVLVTTPAAGAAELSPDVLRAVHAPAVR